MNKTIRLSLLISLVAFLSLQMTCSDLGLSEPDVVEAVCIDKSKIDPNKGCPRDYTPVCGCDYKTYSNACTAEKNGVTKWTDGACPCVVEALKTPDAPCTKEFQPVCGCDNVTYSNECLAKNAGVTKWKKGKCEATSSNDCVDPTKVSKKPCPEIYEPVCGCDNVTYPNSCSAMVKGVTKWTNGKCATNNPCIDKSKIDPSANCTKIYKPVCGCDGNTYGNICEALKAGVQRTKPGKCN